MAEKSVWGYLKQGMRASRWDGMRHECMLNKGVADLSFYLGHNGWIELKEVKKLPARATTGIGLGRWEDLMQRHFLIKRRGWLFIRVNSPRRTYLIFHHSDLPPDERPYWTWDDMVKHAWQLWDLRVDFKELETMLRNAQ